MASSSLHSLTVLTEEDGVPGSKFEREPEEYTVDQPLQKRAHSKTSIVKMQISEK